MIVNYEFTESTIPTNACTHWGNHENPTRTASLR